MKKPQIKSEVAKTEEDVAMKVEAGAVRLKAEDRGAKMKLEEDSKAKVEQAGGIGMSKMEVSPAQRTSSRLKTKDIPDWSFLRGKKRTAEISNPSEVAGKTKKARTGVKKEEVEMKDEPSAKSSGKQRARESIKPKPERETKHKPHSSGADKKENAAVGGSSSRAAASVKVEPFDENFLDFGFPNEEQTGLVMSQKDMIQSSPGKEPKLTPGDTKNSSRKGTGTKAVKKELSPDQGSDEVKAEVKTEAQVKAKKSKKEQGLTLELDTRSRFLAAGIPFLPFAIPDYCDDIHGVKVPRMFISNTYGGGTQATSPTISASKLALHGYDNFIFLGNDLHPLAPQVPGAPGIWINVAQGRSEWNSGIMRVFVRMKGNAKPPLWWYMGQYEFAGTQALTKEEWSLQTVLVKNTWAEATVRYSWGSRMRASILARKILGMEPTLEEMEDYARSGAYTSVGVTDVALALTRGDERLNLFTMKCVGYDDGFQRDVAQKYPAWLQSHPPK